MIQTPVHKQTDPNKKPGQVVYPIKKKLSYEEWYESVRRIPGLGNMSLQATYKMIWEAAQENK